MTYLVHSRTVGSKNGVRNYQYKSGEWTPEGKERRREQYRRAHQNAFKSDGKKPSNAEKLTRSARDAYNEIANIGDKIQRKRPSTSHMDDQELAKVVNRMRLEQQYAELKANDISNGKRIFNNVKNVGGSVLNVAVSAAAITTAVMSIKNAFEGNGGKK